MTTVAFKRVTAYPGTIEANTIYFITNGDDRVELVVVGDDVSTPRELNVRLVLGEDYGNSGELTLSVTDTLQEAIYKLRDQIVASRLTGYEILSTPIDSLSDTSVSAVVVGDSIQLSINKLQNQINVLNKQAGPPALFKPATMTGPCIKKIQPSVVAVAQGTQFRTSEGLFTVAQDLTVADSDTYVPGMDYEVFIDSDMAPFSAIAGRIPVTGTGIHAGRILIGGFHYSCMEEDTDIDTGAFNTSASTGGMIWAPGDVDKIVGVNEFSIWDLNYRPVCSPRGMARVVGQGGRTSFWFDIYLCNQMPEVIGTSSFDRSITNQSFIPVVSPLFPNGLAQYQQLSWFTAAEIGATAGKRMMSYREFTLAAFGVTENISYGTATPNPESTGFLPGFTSKWGGMQMSGTFWVWGGEPIIDPAPGNDVWIEGDRGDFSGNIRGLRFGGAYDSNIRSGSQCVSAEAAANYGQSLTSMRFAADHFDRNPNIVLN